MLSGLLIWSVMTESDVLEHSFLNRRRLEKFTPLA
jgi:hypothetical protein